MKTYLTAKPYNKTNIGGEKRTALYCRLSRDDDNEGERVFGARLLRRLREEDVSVPLHDKQAKAVL